MPVLERLLLRERPIVLVGLCGVIVLSWLYLVPASLDMYGAMDGLSAWMMQTHWDVRYFVLVFLMWAVMMVGMMLPSAAPAILLYARVQRTSAGVEAPTLRIQAFTAGYLLAWTGFSLAATLLQYALSRAALLSPMWESASPVLGAVLLVNAGLYQLTPFKQSCLSRCRSPAGFFMQHWRPGVRGALRLGVRHGLYCVGCCWALMLLLFVGGVMSLLWIGAITVFVLIEKLAPLGVQGGRLSGALLALAGIVLLASA
ncbi:DUF2182 domain-containing protein [Fontimonas sp. SYSU GA230001]|uniref:DUF2182 domain-containing protein n=1 Tax=Fontimonas sp. SYSU GA230001 TaxID=3142450 RepID=UPI0032B4A12D